MSMQVTASGREVWPWQETKYCVWENFEGVIFWLRRMMQISQFFPANTNEYSEFTEDLPSDPPTHHLLCQ